MYVVDKQMCSGCFVCKEICPVNAIDIVIDEEGFRYPQINQEKCIECGKCRQACAFKRNEIQHDKKPIDVIGAKIKDEKERITSRSGGIFIALANYILEQNGVIYGCKMGENFEVYHSRATDKKETDKFKGSKYVQSDLKDVYIQVKQDLVDGKKVLFSGTGCQIAGLNLVVEGINTENLYTCDLICHGVPSPLIFKEYINFWEEKEKSKIINIDFRDKSYGWTPHKETLYFKDKKLTTEYFKELFYAHYILRPSCFNCSFANMDRIADITIGDFWGIHKENAEFNDEKGLSIILVNTEKGNKLFQDIKEKTEWIQVTSDSYLQRNLREPSDKPEDREIFWEDYKKYGFEYIMRKYAKYQEN